MDSDPMCHWRLPLPWGGQMQWVSAVTYYSISSMGSSYLVLLCDFHYLMNVWDTYVHVHVTGFEFLSYKSVFAFPLYPAYEECHPPTHASPGGPAGDTSLSTTSDSFVYEAVSRPANQARRSLSFSPCRRRSLNDNDVAWVVFLCFVYFCLTFCLALTHNSHPPFTPLFCHPFPPLTHTISEHFPLHFDQIIPHTTLDSCCINNMDKRFIYFLFWLSSSFQTSAAVCYVTQLLPPYCRTGGQGRGGRGWRDSALPTLIRSLTHFNCPVCLFYQVCCLFVNYKFWFNFSHFFLPCFSFLSLHLFLFLHLLFLSSGYSLLSSPSFPQEFSW